jgi:hypothetical protein
MRLSYACTKVTLIYLKVDNSQSPRYCHNSIAPGSWAKLWSRTNSAGLKLPICEELSDIILIPSRAELGDGQNIQFI